MTGDPDRVHAVFGLLIDPLPQAVRTRLIMDEAFCRDLGIRSEFWFPLADDLTVKAGSLNNALRAAVAGKKSTRISLKGGKRRQVKLGFRSGTATIEVGTRGFSFSYADLLSADPPKRRRALSRAFSQRPLLPDEEQAWKENAKKRSLTDREYLVLMTALNATPEAVGKELHNSRNFNNHDLMPEEPTYYHRLVAPLDKSRTLSAFIEGELADLRGALLAAHPQRALRRIAYSALSQPLIPFDLLASLSFSDVERLASAKDPFSLLFGFELCRLLLPSNDTFDELGSAFLEKLFGDPDQGMARCEVFSGLSIITTIGLRAAAKAAGAPLFWVRLAALAHAGVLTDALGEPPDAKGFLQWAVENFLGAYTWHSVVDRRDAPRWSPDWISPEHVYAELVGRAHISLHLLSDAERPARWSRIIDSAIARLNDTGQLVAAFFPGPFDDFREDAIPTSSSNPIYREVEEGLQTASKLGDVPGLSALVNSVQISERALSDIIRLAGGPVADPIADGAPDLLFLRLCAHVAASTRSEALAEIVINRCLFKARSHTNEGEAITDLFVVMALACAAQAETHAYGKLLGQTATKLCFIVDADEELAHLDSIMEVLGRRDERLIPALAQARATAATKKRM